MFSRMLVAKRTGSCPTIPNFERKKERKKYGGLERTRKGQEKKGKRKSSPIWLRSHSTFMDEISIPSKRTLPEDGE